MLIKIANGNDCLRHKICDQSKDDHVVHGLVLKIYGFFVVLIDQVNNF